MSSQPSVKTSKNPLVCVIAHPDDEAFGPAGSLAYFAQTRPVHILCATSGDADERFSNRDSLELGKVREKELLASAGILGVTSVDFLGFKDGGLCNNNYHQLAGKIQAKVEQYNPDTLLTFDINGISGHLDHIAVSLVTSFVFRKMPSVQTLLYYAELKVWMEAVWGEIGDYFVFVPPGRERSEIGLTIDTSAFWNTRVRAMDAHVSQKNDADWLKKVLEKLPRQEHFIVSQKSK